jgi:peptide/nickel transport system substrate-binding protein
MAGSIDHTNLENPSSFVEATKRAQAPDAHVYIAWGPEMLSFPLQLNLSTTLGVESERDAALRELFRNFDFRRALSHAIDREGVAQAIIRGPFLREFPGGLYPGASEFDYDSVVYYPYAPDSAKALLAGLGFEDTDGNGILNWTSGPLEGEDLIISVVYSEDVAAAGQIAEVLNPLLAEVGIQINVRPLQGPAMDDAIQTGKWEMWVDRSGQEFATPFTFCDRLAPTDNLRPYWHRASAEGRELLPFEEDLVDIVNQFCAESDSAKRAELMKEYNKLFTENVYIVGTVIGRYGLALAKRFRNVPVGAPPFYYQWTWGNVQPDQIWVPADEQLEETLPDTIPIYNK